MRITLFTLLELILVVAVLAVVAGGVVIFYMDRAEETVGEDIALAEMAAIKRALLQFRKDTGFFPREGPFDLEPDGLVGANTIPAWVAPADRIRWFDAPGNFWQLYQAPLRNNPALTTEVMPWNIDNARGWRGPYLSTDGNGLVDIGDDINMDVNGINGNPTQGNFVENIYGVADSFLAKPIFHSDPDRFTLEWQNFGTGPEYDRWGRPYLLFGFFGTDARILSMGANGTFENGNGDDLVLFIDPN